MILPEQKTDYVDSDDMILPEQKTDYVSPSFNDLISEWDVSKVTDMDLKNNDNDDL